AIDSTSGLTLGSNKYFKGSGTWFEIADAGRTFPQWQSSTESTAIQQASTFPAPGRTLATYAASLGVGSTHDDMMTALRTQSKDTWNSAYTIDALLAYFRAGYGVTPGAP